MIVFVGKSYKSIGIYFRSKKDIETPIKKEGPKKEPSMNTCILIKPP